MQGHAQSTWCPTNSHSTSTTLDGDRTVDVIEPNARTPRSDLATQIVTDILTVFDRQSKVIRDRAVNSTCPDLGVGARRDYQHDRSVDRAQSHTFCGIQPGN